VRLLRTALVLPLALALAAAPAFAANVHRAPTAAAKKSTKTTKSTKASARSRRPKAQQSIEPERVSQIQQALIRVHYLNGEPNGNWDSTTIAAMQRFQADQGWQTRIMPDPRAIKVLGLGPDYSNAINARGGSFGDPPPVATIPHDQAEGFTLASGVKQ